MNKDSTVCNSIDWTSFFQSLSNVNTDRKKFCNKALFIIIGKPKTIVNIRIISLIDIFIYVGTVKVFHLR
jgi:hypothetical protein